MEIDLDERNGRRGKERYCALLQGRMEYLAVLYLQRGTINKETNLSKLQYDTGTTILTHL